jgi:DNA primase
MKNTVENIVLTQKDMQGKIKANIPDYYERYIKPQEDKYKDSDLHTNRTAICPLPNHNDTDPSFGLTNHKFYKGVKIYHCFGCGGSGTIIRLHQRIQSKYHNRKLTEHESALELAELFGVDLANATDDESTEEIEGSAYISRVKTIRELQDRYTVRDYQRELLGVRMRDDVSLEVRAKAVNKSIIKMIATDKKLYEM